VNLKKLILILGWVVTLSINLAAQTDPESTDFIANIIEEFIESNEEEEFDYNTIFENLHYYASHPLNINSAREQDLRDLFLLNELQISDFFQHKADFGAFLSIYELQSIPSWDLETIKNLEPFLTCNIAAADFNLNFKDALTKGHSLLYLKAKRVLQERRGFVKDDTGTKPYAGDPNHFYARYRYEYGQSFKAGLTMEKDPGEKFFGEGSKYGFDFYSFFAYAKDINKTFSIVSLGDFAVSMGQGLILHNDFGTRKSSLVMNVKKAGRTLRPYSSVNETNFFRGGGTVINLGKAWQTAVFVSYRPTDASTTTALDTIENTDFDYFGSIRSDGYHRTTSEIANKNAIHEFNAGTKVQYKTRNLKLAFNGLYTNFDIPLIRDASLYKKYLFAGQRLLNTSVDYSWRYRNATFFGETAMSDNGGFANLHGVLLGLDKSIDVSAIYRNFDPDYQVLNANAFAESSMPINEKGFYLGMEIRPLRGVLISTYADFWSHPWLGYRRDGLTGGKEFMIKLSYIQKRKLELYAQYRYKYKQQNASDEQIINHPIDQTLQRLRLHFGYKINKEWEIKDRIEFSFFKQSTSSSGMLMYQDLIYKPIAKPYSFTARYAIFDINSFDARIYAFDNDILYEYYIPFYYNRGNRFYINTRFRLGRNYTWEFRIGRTYYDNLESISSGNNLINGNTMTEIKTQLKIKF